MFQSSFIKRDSYQLKKHVLKVIHIPHHRLSVETSVRIAEIQIQSVDTFYLEMNQTIKNFPVQILGCIIKTCTALFLLKPGKQVYITQILKKIDEFPGQVSEYLRYRESF